MSKDGTRQDRWELLGRAMWTLRVALEQPVGDAISQVDPEVHGRLQERKGSAETDMGDVKALLNCLAHSPRLRRQLFGSETACFDEINLLVEMRNFWAHTRGITKGNLSEALDAANTVLAALHDQEAAQAIRELQSNPPPSVQAERLLRRQQELDQRQRSDQEWEALQQECEQLQEALDTHRADRAELDQWEQRLERWQTELQRLELRLELKAGRLDRQQARLEQREAEPTAWSLNRAPAMFRQRPQRSPGPPRQAPEPLPRRHVQPAYSNGLSTATPSCSKSRTLRVTTVRSWTRAVAAMTAS